MTRKEAETGERRRGRIPGTRRAGDANYAVTSVR